MLDRSIDSGIFRADMGDRFSSVDRLAWMLCDLQRLAFGFWPCSTMFFFVMIWYHHVGGIRYLLGFCVSTLEKP
jgi:hypothetical protein